MTASRVPRDPTISQEHRRFLDDLARAQLRNNYQAIVAPAVTDDANHNYTVGSRWIDTVAHKEYVCCDATAGAAVWKQSA